MSAVAFLVVAKVFSLSVISGIVVTLLTVLSSEISRKTQNREETDKSYALNVLKVSVLSYHFFLNVWFCISM